MFEIGNSLREARLRQGLEYVDIEQQTKIRSKYLKALEDEQFEVLPAPTFVKGFLRNYADALGLDGQLYVDEYNSRFVLIAVGGIAAVVAIVLAAWKFGSSDNPQLVTQNVVQQKKHKRVRPAARPVKLVLTAVDGKSWLEIRANSVNG